MKHALIILTLLMTGTCFSQVVKGFIVNKENEPLIGAQVMESDYRNGTTSNIDGSFILTLNDPNSYVVFSFAGYESDSLVLQHDKLSQVVLKNASSGYSVDFAGLMSDYRVLLILLWTVICVWLVIRTFRGVASA